MVDFTVIDHNQREQSSITRGGLLEVRSHEQVLQEQRESSKLLVVYTSPADIPPSPSEPSEQPFEEFKVEEAFGSPGEETKVRRTFIYDYLCTRCSQNLQTREAQYYASRAPQSNPSIVSVAAQSQTPDISSLLKIINSQQQPQHVQQQPPQPTPAQSPPGGLEAIFAQFASSSGQQPPQAQMQAPTHPAPTPNGYNLQAALAAMNVANPTQPSYIPPPPNQQPNLQSILAQFGQQPAAQMQNYGYSNAYQMENDRKRQAEFDDAAGGEYGFGKSKRQKGEEKKVSRFSLALCQQLTDSLSFSTSGLHATLADSGWKASAERATAALTFIRRNLLDNKGCRLCNRNSAGCSGSLHDHGWHGL